MTTTSTRLPAGPDAPRPQNGDPMADNPDTGDRHDPAVFAISTLPLLLALCLGSVLFWLFAAGCGAGDDTPADTGAQTPAPAAAETAPPTTTAPPPTTADNPAPGEPGYDPYLDPCSDVNTAHSRRRAADARALMDQAETGGSPAADAAGQVADIRREIGWDRDCEGVWGAEDDARLEALERAAETPPPTSEDAETAETDSPDTGDGETPAGTAAPPATDDGHDHADNDGHDHGDNDGHDHGPVLPDDPEWVDELPEPLDPDPEPVGAVLDWDQFKLRPLAEARPDVCAHKPWWCVTGDQPARWTWGPMQVTIGTRAATPRNPAADKTGVYDNDRGEQVRITQYGKTYSYTVTGFNPQDLDDDGLRDVRILVRVTTDDRWDWENLTTGESGQEADPDKMFDDSVLAVVLPEHAGTVTFDAGGNMTGATLLVFYPPPAGGEGG